MPRSSQQLEQIRDDRRDQIVAAALMLFAERGYAGTPVRAIAAEAGISQGLLYNYFDGKEGLLRAIFADNLAQVGATFGPAEAAPTPRAAIELLVRAALDAVRANVDFWRLSYQLRMQPAVLTGLGGEVRGAAAEIVGRIERIYLRARADASGVRARALFAAIDGAAQHYVLDVDGYPLDDVGAAIIGQFTSDLT